MRSYYCAARRIMLSYYYSPAMALGGYGVLTMAHLDDYARWAYDMGLAHGADARCAPPVAGQCDPAYASGFKAGRAAQVAL